MYARFATSVGEKSLVPFGMLGFIKLILSFKFLSAMLLVRPLKNLHLRLKIASTNIVKNYTFLGLVKVLFICLKLYKEAFNSKPNNSIIEFNHTNSIKIKSVPIEPYS